MVMGMINGIEDDVYVKHILLQLQLQDILNLRLVNKAHCNFFRESEMFWCLYTIRFVNEDYKKRQQQRKPLNLNSLFSFQSQIPKSSNSIELNFQLSWQNTFRNLVSRQKNLKMEQLTDNYLNQRSLEDVLLKNLQQFQLEAPFFKSNKLKVLTKVSNKDLPVKAFFEKHLDPLEPTCITGLMENWNPMKCWKIWGSEIETRIES